MKCLSFSYLNGDTAVRGRLAFTTSKQRQVLAMLCPPHSNREAVLLCTCNRTDLYFTGFECEEAYAVLAMQSGLEVDVLRRQMSFYSGEEALTYLLRVTGGLCSMVLGEDEILGQVKDAYRVACDAGTVGTILHSAFQAAITCGKRIRTETALSSTPISISTLAAHEAVRAGEKILIIGATGKIGRAVVKHLYSHPNAHVTVTRRTCSNDLDFFDESIRVIDYAQRYEALSTTDCVISATTSPHYTLAHEALAQTTRTKPLLLIDLAVPFDIDPAVVRLPNITRLTLDDFEHLAKKQNAIRLAEAKNAEQIIRSFLKVI